jgi:Reverse transcriptase (RNA-dependent DNA polymerase)
VEEFKFKKSQADECVLTREDEHGVIILCIYVDDALMVRDHAAIEKTVAQLKTKVSLKDVGPLSEYVGCTMLKDPYKQKLWIWQLDLISKMEGIFKQHSQVLQKYKTPAGVGLGLVVLPFNALMFSPNALTARLTSSVVI